MAFDEAVIVMGKPPRPGRVKTRLSPPLGTRASAELYARMLGDTLAEISTMKRCRRYLFLDSPEPGDIPFRAPVEAFQRFPQRGRDLGERMLDAASTAFRLGARRAAIVGADCPSLSAGRIREAFRELSAGASVVFGPSTDGGYYLVGLPAPEAWLFRGVSWSTPDVLADAAARCRKRSATFSFLPVERDVDTPEDLDALRAWAGGHAEPACPGTRAWIRAFSASGCGGFPGRKDRTPGSPRGRRSPRGE